MKDLIYFKNKLLKLGYPCATPNGGGWIRMARYLDQSVKTKSQAKQVLEAKFPRTKPHQRSGPVSVIFSAKPAPKKRLSREDWAKKTQEFYKSREWMELRYRALNAYGARCQCCGASAKDGALIHVDHIKPRSRFPELELSFDNLQVLCEECNMGKSNQYENDWRPAELHQENVLKLRAIK